MAHLNKFIETRNKIGHQYTTGDDEAIIIYTVLKEYRDVMSDDIKDEPEFVTLGGSSDLVKNPNFSLLEEIDAILTRYDKKLGLSFWDKSRKR